MIHLPLLMLGSMLALASAGLDATRADIPGQPVHVAIDIPGFRRDAQSLDPERVLVSGKTEAECIVSILYEENFPFFSSQDAAKRFVADRRVQSFSVDEIACVEFKTEIRNAVVESTFHAYPVTPDYLFDVQVSFVVPKEDVGKARTFSRKDFVSLVQSFRVEGRPDAKGLRLPAEIYAYRDEAAAAKTDPIGWATKQCIVRAGEWPTHFYLGVLALALEKPDKAVEGLTRAADLLEAMPERSAKHTLALVQALDRAAGVHAADRKYEKAIPLCDRIVLAAKADAPPDIRKFREEALFNLAGCYARTGQNEKALATLKLALEARPDFKARAASSEMMEPLRNLPGFKALVGDG